MKITFSASDRLDSRNSHARPTQRGWCNRCSLDIVIPDINGSFLWPVFSFWALKVIGPDWTRNVGEGTVVRTHFEPTLCRPWEDIHVDQSELLCSDPFNHRFTSIHLRAQMRIRVNEYITYNQIINWLTIYECSKLTLQCNALCSSTRSWPLEESYSGEYTTSADVDGYPQIVQK